MLLPPYDADDEAWLVVDKDRWTDEQLDELYKWTHTNQNYGLALSNPNFEYWLLLHFEDGNKIGSAQDCKERLARYLPGYDKSIDASKFTAEKISAAIHRAKQRDNPPCEKWPHSIGGN